MAKLVKHKGTGETQGTAQTPTCPLLPLVSVFCTPVLFTMDQLVQLCPFGKSYGGHEEGSTHVAPQAPTVRN